MLQIKLCLLFILMIYNITYVEAEELDIRLHLDERGSAFIFTAENWSSDKVMKKFNLCLSEENGIDLGFMSKSLFVPLEIKSQFYSHCILKPSITIGKYEVVGTIYSRSILEDIYSFPKGKNFPLAFRVCFEEHCIYSNSLNENNSESD